MAGSSGLVAQGESPKRQKSSSCSGCSLCNCRDKICFAFWPGWNAAGLGGPWGWCVWWRAVPTAPFLCGRSPWLQQGRVLCLGEESRVYLLVERRTWIPVWPALLKYSQSVLAEGAAHGHSVFWQDVMILLTFQYVLKIDSVSVFCKDLEPVFPFYFWFFFSDRVLRHCRPVPVVSKATAEGPWQCHQPPQCPGCCKNLCLQTPGQCFIRGL